jgi:DNA-binding NtrC family response regulator
MTSPVPNTDLPPLGPPIPELIGSGPAMQAVYRQVRQVAASNAPILLLGELGTGKELIARAIHRLSPRVHGRFVRLPCGAMPASALDADPFGHAIDATGEFDSVGGSTLFLDEIHLAMPELQAKLLGLFEPGNGPAGGVRVIAASDHDLMEEAEVGRFREDLYYHLSVVAIRVPPLRGRREDISALADHFLAFYSRKNGRHVTRFEPAAMRAIEAYNWPGNLREMRNCIERAVVLAPGDALTCDLLPEPMRGGKPHRVGRGRGADLETLAAELIQNGLEAADPAALDLHARIVDPIERELLAQVMAACDNVQVKAAERLGMNRNTLRKKLKQYGLEK